MRPMTMPATRRRAGPATFAAALAAVLLLPAGLASAPVPAAAQSAASHTLTAKYELLFGGARIARFYFDGEVEKAAYDVKGTARSSTFGKLVLDFKGRTNASGSLDGNRIAPGRYNLRVESGKTSTVEMRFDGRAVEKISLKPPASAPKARVPLKPEHRVGVLDPMSAALLPLPAGDLSADNACDRTVPVFTGSERFDLVMSFKRKESLPAANGSGTAELYVCKVRYVPIAGHKPERSQTKFLAATQDIELWLAPQRETGMFLPYRAVLPTPVGTATLNLEHYDASAGGDGADR